MSEINSITALGRLLRDGSLRDRYAIRPEKTIRELNVVESEVGTLLKLNPDDLEAQADVLLRKRYEAVLRLIPQTCKTLGREAWPVFADYARCCWPPEENSAPKDARRFCEHLLKKRQFIAPQNERNRIAFRLGKKRVAIHVVKNLVIGNRLRTGFQVFFRGEASWSEHVIYYPF